MWEIYSVGDAAFLEAILNGVAMLTGNGDIRALASIGFVVGVIIVAFQSIASGGQGMKWGDMMVAWILYAVMFGPSGNVVIYSVYDWSARTVNNVPFGIAAVGSFLSRGTYILTKDFEQAFGLPTMTNQGFGRTLEILLSTRKNTMGPANSVEPVSGDDDFSRTLTNYIQDCTLVGIQIGDISADKIRRAPDTLAALAFNNPAYTTVTYLVGDPVSGQLRTCPNAFTEIQNQYTGNYLPVWETFLNKAYGTPYQSEVQQALDGIVGVGKNARTYMMNAYLTDVYRRAEDGALTWEEAGASLIETQAIEQLRVQNAAESSIFLRIARPLMAFMEGFTYALAPFMAMMIALGTLGIRLAAKYFMTLLWIQLWMPVMAIINLFINMTVQNKMASLQDAGVGGPGSTIDPTSMAGLLISHSTFADYISVAGTLAAATPAITLMIIYGTSVTATHLAGKLTPTDTVSEKNVAPDLAGVGSVVSMSPQYSHNMMAGASYTGAAQALPSMEVGTMAKQSLSAGSSTSWDAASKYINNAENRATLSNAIQAGSGHTDTFMKSTAQEMSKGLGWDSSQTQQNLAKIAGAFALSAKGGGTGASLQNALETQFGAKTAETMMQNLQNKYGTNYGEQVHDSLEQSMRRDEATGTVSGMHTAMGRTDANQLQNRYERDNHLSSRGNVDLATLSNQALEKGTAADLVSRARDLGLGGEIENWATKDASYYGIHDRGRAEFVGAMLALRNSASNGNEAARDLLLDGVAGTMGYGTAGPRGSTAGADDAGGRAPTDAAIAAAQGTVNTDTGSAGTVGAQHLNWEKHNTDVLANNAKASATEKARDEIEAQMARKLDLGGGRAGTQSNMAKNVGEAELALLRGSYDMMLNAGDTVASSVHGLSGFLKGFKADNPDGSDPGFVDRFRNAFNQADIDRGAYYQALHDSAFHYAQEQYGFNEAQANYYAANQVSGVNRLLGGVGLSQNMDDLRAKVGNDVVADTIAKGVNTGDKGYFQSVQMWNDPTAHR